MAGYNELLVGRYNRFVQKLFSMKGKANLESLNPELHVVLVTFHGVENRYLEGWDRFALARGVGAQGAGNQSVMELRNPAASNVMVVVETLIGSTGGAAATQIVIGVGLTNADQVSTSNGTGYDPRGRTISSAITSIGSASLSLSDVQTIAVGINVPWQFINDESQEIPILPGNALTIRSTTVNQAANFTIGWRERAMEESELK